MNSLNRIELLKKYVADDPDDIFSKYALALEYIKAGEDQMAETLMQELITLHPEYLPNYYHFGKLQERKMDFSLASDIYTKGIEVAKTAGDQHTLSELVGALDNLD